ncbi:YceI family protein [Prolixibacter sp. SD074]|uniref:YceI family protein n=1 Tax=Prolixibacter sp. SD074 TaxID=2652391 RepID=UPI00189065C1|nr:YceI family protein [Prolixibacter sp. SD074]
MRVISLLAAVLFLGNWQVKAQESFHLVADKSSAEVDGTSTLHDWNMKTTDLKCAAVMEMDGTVVNNIENVAFSCPAKSLKSHESSMMDKKAYKAIKSDKHPEILFTSDKVENLESNGNEFSGDLVGKLQLVGVTKTIKIPFKGKVTDASHAVVNGSFKLKMSEYGIEQVTAMLGAIKTGDDLTIKYNFELGK